jgi:hypothetical protein
MSPQRSTEDAVVEALPARGQRVADHHRAVDGGALLVAGEQQGQREPRVGPQGQEVLDGDHEGGQRGLHVAGAAAVEPAIAVGGREGMAVPLFQRTGGHDVGMAGEDQRARGLGARAAGAHGPQVGHAEVGGAAFEGLEPEAQPRQPLAEDLLAARIVGSDRRARDQLFGELQRAGHRKASGGRRA